MEFSSFLLLMYNVLLLLLSTWMVIRNLIDLLQAFSWGTARLSYTSKADNKNLCLYQLAKMNMQFSLPRRKNLWLRLLFSKLLNCSKWHDKATFKPPSFLYLDSTVDIKLATNQHVSGRIKHIDLCLPVLHELIANGIVEL